MPRRQNTEHPLTLERSLVESLQRQDVEIHVLNADTVIFRNVPTDRRYFTRPRTSLLVKRPHGGRPFLVCVDDELEYRGAERSLTRLFVGGPCHDGWRALLLGPIDGEKFGAAVHRGLLAVGFDRQEQRDGPMLTDDEDRTGAGLIVSHGASLSESARGGRSRVICGRDEEVEQVTACVLRWGAARLAVVVGEPGVGKSALLDGVASRLNESRPELNLVSVNMAEVLAGTLFEAERESLLTTLLGEALDPGSTVLALERFDLVLRSIPQGPALVAQALDRGIRLLGTMLPADLRLLCSPPLAPRASAVVLKELRGAAAVQALETMRCLIAGHHDVHIDESLVAVCVRAARSLRGYLPGKAVTLLDTAASRCALSGRRAVYPDDIYSALSGDLGALMTAPEGTE